MKKSEIKKSNSEIQNNLADDMVPEDQKPILEQATKGHGAIDTRADHLMLKEQSLVQRLFPSPSDKMVQRINEQITESALESRLNLYRLHREALLEVAYDIYNAYRIKMGSQLQAHLTQELLQLYKDVQESVLQKEDEMIDLVEKRYELAERLNKYPEKKARYIQHAEEQEELYLTVLRDAVADFKQAINNRIPRQKMGLK